MNKIFKSSLLEKGVIICEITKRFKILDRTSKIDPDYLYGFG